MLIPNDPNSTIVMFNGLAWLFLGVLTSRSLLYPEVRTSIIFMTHECYFLVFRAAFNHPPRQDLDKGEVLLELIQAFNTTDRRRPADIQYLWLG